MFTHAPKQNPLPDFYHDLQADGNHPFPLNSNSLIIHLIVLRNGVFFSFNNILTTVNTILLLQLLGFTRRMNE